MKDNIKKIIVEWQEGRPENLFNRDYQLAFSEEIDVVVGLRRSGKTYFLFSAIRELIGQGVEPSAIMYINFDDERLVDLKGGDLELVIEAYFELYPENLGKQVYLFFDEIQDIEHWHLFIKRLYERKKYHIILTGSSSKLMSKELATELRGRTLALNFFPLAFKEYLEFKEVSISKNIEYSEKRFKVIHHAEEFLRYGGYPRVSLEPSELRKKDLLRDYLDMIIFRDIVERHDVRNVHLLRACVNFLLTNFAAEFSINGFIKKFKKEYQPNKVTVFNYFSYLEEAGFFYYLPMFSYKIHQRYLAKKIYIADNGFIRLLAFRGMEVPGRLLENLVFTELYKRNETIFYYKDSQNYECDFLVTRDERVVKAIQVTYKMAEENREREIRGLVSAMEKFGLEEGMIITNDEQGTIDVPGGKISMVPAWKWMIE